MDVLNKPLIEKSHPKEKASLFSQLFFAWQLPILYKGYREHFTESDLYNPLKEHDSKNLGDKLEKVWFEELAIAGRDASLWKALAKTFGWEFLLYGLLLIPLEVILNLSYPLLIWKLLLHYTTNEDNTSNKELYIYTSLMIISTFLRVMGFHHVWFRAEYLGMKIRIACSAVIYRKCLTLSQNSLSKITLGHVVNLLANDVTKFNCGLIRYVHYIWVLPIVISISIYCLCIISGSTAVSGISVVVALVPLQMFLFKRIAVYRLKMAKKSDQRVRLTNEIIEGIRVIKMLAWEKPFFKLINSIRKLEVDDLRASMNPYGIITAFTLCMSRTAVFLCVLVLFLSGQVIQAEHIFVLTAFYEILKVIATRYVPWGAVCLGEIRTAVKRIQLFLKSADTQSKKEGNSYKGITLNSIYVEQDILSDTTLTINPNQLTAFIGPVGCGKTTLLNIILKEIPVLQGSVHIGGTISYASQEAWIFHGTVKQNILFGEKFNEVKYNEVVKVCALERDLLTLPCGDLTVVGSKGLTLSGGQKSRINLARAVYKKADCYLLDDPLASVDAQVGKNIFENCFKKYLKNKTVVLVTHQIQYLDEVDYIYVLENGKFVDSGTYEALESNDCLKMLQTEKLNTIEDIEDTVKIRMSPDFKIKPYDNEQINVGTISRRVYKYYLMTGGLSLSIKIIIVHIFTHFVGHGLGYLFRIWVNVQEQNAQTVPNYFVYTYAICVVLIIPLSFISMFLFINFFINTTKNLHNKMLHSVISTPLNFFNSNGSGQVLNRFSSDIGQIDRILPFVVMDVFIITLTFIGRVSLLVIVNLWVLLPTIIIVTIFFYTRKIYLKTSRIIKRLEAQSRSPLFTHVNTTLQGLSTIRALEGEQFEETLFNNYQDMNTAASYMFLACDSAFGFWLDFCSFIYFAIIMVSVLFAKSELRGGDVGLTVTCACTLIGMLQYGMKQYAELENQMVSVERVSEYSELTAERDSDSKLVKQWPSSAKLEFKNVSLRYNPLHSLVLENITFVVQPNEKIGIVGRTGAGKSSLISVLFRLFEFDGDIVIDDVNTKTIPLQLLRSKISIIPQEPVLFSCSLRTNLDPFDAYEDSNLWNALEEVQMKELVSALPLGLSTTLREGDSSFSSGQKQLLCLARAIVRMNKIVVLDEATANVDLKTEELIRDSIRKRFRECTVLTIAHRIKTVMDSDKILVIDDGRVLEFDSPSKLLQDTRGAFYKLVHLGNVTT